MSGEMDAKIRGPRGRRSITIGVEASPGNKAMDNAIRAAAGRLPRELNAASTITEDDDAFARRAKTLGVASDLVDVARGLIPGADELKGAALHSALAKAIGERPSLSPDFDAHFARLPAGVDGGADRNVRSDASTDSDMNHLIRVAAGKEAPRSVIATNGVDIAGRH
jgi:hypothetical protein